MSTCRPGFHSRVEVEAALGLPAGQVGADVADQEVVVERLAREGETEHAAARRRLRGPGRRRRTSRAPTVAVRGRAGDRHPVLVLLDAGDLVAPADVDAAARRRCARRAAASVSHCEMFTNGGNGERPRSANVKLNSSRSRWKVRAVVQVTPRRAISAPTPTASQTSRTSRCWQIALLPIEVALGAAVEDDDGQAPAGQEQRGGLADRAAAQHQDEAPGRVIASSALQLVPDGAVALRRPDDGALDAVHLVPEALHVEGQAVLEDRPVAVLRRRARRGWRRRRP